MGNCCCAEKNNCVYDSSEHTSSNNEHLYADVYNRVYDSYRDDTVK